MHCKRFERRISDFRRNYLSAEGRMNTESRAQLPYRRECELRTFHEVEASAQTYHDFRQKYMRGGATRQEKQMVTQTAVGISVTKERAAAIATIAAAFRTDPVCRWVWPDDAQYDRYFSPFVEAFAGGAFENGSAHVAEDFGGVALWLPPGVKSDEGALGEIAEASIAPEAQEEAFGFLGQQAEAHPHEAHWYLPLIGVDAKHQGRGYGSALLEHALCIVDEQGLPAYLEATSERNKALYERHGFEVVGEIQYGSSPTMWPMYRKAR
jgi:GNAT superfamily N-acetyltransferase